MDVTTARWIRDLLCRTRLTLTTDIIMSSLDGEEYSPHLSEVDRHSLILDASFCPLIPTKYSFYCLLEECMWQVHNGEILSIECEHLLLFDREGCLSVGE